MTTRDFQVAVRSNISLNMLKRIRTIMQWLRRNKCPLSPQCYRQALENMKYDIVKWLHEEKCPHDDETFELVMQEFLVLSEQQNAAVSTAIE
jgi:hypothetical protein